MKNVQRIMNFSDTKISFHVRSKVEDQTRPKTSDDIVCRNRPSFLQKNNEKLSLNVISVICFCE